MGIAKDVTDAEVFEFGPTGTSDLGFDNPKFAWKPGGRNQANATAILSNGEVVVAGEGAKELTGPESVYGLALSRLIRRFQMSSLEFCRS